MPGDLACQGLSGPAGARQAFLDPERPCGRSCEPTWRRARRCSTRASSRPRLSMPTAFDRPPPAREPVTACTSRAAGSGRHGRDDRRAPRRGGLPAALRRRLGAPGEKAGLKGPARAGRARQARQGSGRPVPGRAGREPAARAERHQPRGPPQGGRRLWELAVHQAGQVRTPSRPATSEAACPDTRPLLARNLAPSLTSRRNRPCTSNGTYVFPLATRNRSSSPTKSERNSRTCGSSIGQSRREAPFLVKGHADAASGSKANSATGSMRRKMTSSRQLAPKSDGSGTSDV